MRAGRLPLFLLCGLCFFFLAVHDAAATTADQVQARVDQDLKAGRPLVVHVVVALCDNLHQGIVPVPVQLGNGRDPRNNLYWGAAFGVKTFLRRRAGYALLEESRDPEAFILERIVLHRTVDRGGRTVDLYLVAEAWDGQRIKEAIGRFVSIAAGRVHQPVVVQRDGNQLSLQAASDAALVVFVGHNGLMDFQLAEVPASDPEGSPRSAVVLACASQPYFRRVLRQVEAHPLLLTTGLMAPEAYTLEAAVSAFAAGKKPAEVRQAAAAAYHRYQKCGQRAALRLFVAEE